MKSDDPEPRQYQEVNIDSIIGPTHSFSGLSRGNLASMKHQDQVSHPRKAALEGLNKMKDLHELGIPQLILPPHERPHLERLKDNGYTGSIESILEKLSKDNPALLKTAFSSASMWTANTVTITPSLDSQDDKIHITPANFSQTAHRQIETKFTSLLYQYLFTDPTLVTHHPPLPMHLADEGAANHNRLTSSINQPGLNIFVYGDITHENESKFPIRQSLEASQMIATQHQLRNSFFIQQQTNSINSGAFHHDIVGVTNENVYLYHEFTYQDPNAIKEIESEFYKYYQSSLITIKIPNDCIPIEHIIESYVLNSQLVTTKDQKMVLISPEKCLEFDSVRLWIHEVIESSKNPIHKVKFIPVKESMMNGGGPACLRCRAVLSDKELQSVKPELIFDLNMYEVLVDWVTKYYRNELHFNDFLDPKFTQDCHNALDELTNILKFDSIYPFQK